MGNANSLLSVLSNVSAHIYLNSFGYILNLEDNMRSLNDQMAELLSRRDDVNRAVGTAETRGMQRLNEVQNWLTTVERLRLEVSRIDEEFQRQSRCFGDCSLNVYMLYRLSRDAKRMLEEARRLYQNGNNFSRLAEELPIRIREMSSASSVVEIGSSVLEQLHAFVARKEGGILGIWGMGGVGKTTLLKRFNNELLSFLDSSSNELRDCGIEMVMFIKDVSEKPNIEKIQRTILGMLSLPWQENDSLEERADKISQILSRRRTVIMLDDVWEPLNLEQVGIPTPDFSNGRKLIVATRKEDVCIRMGARENIVKVECLDSEAAWNLFIQAAGEKLVSSNPTIHYYAEAIVKICGGLPGALSTIGRAMATKRHIDEWRDALMVLTNNPEQFHQDMERDVLCCLKRSYDNLPSDLLFRSCFLYVCLYPGGFGVDRSDIISYCIGEGLLSDINDVNVALGRVQNIIGRLSTSSLLECDEVYTYLVKVHSMVRLMALWVASDYGKERNKWLVEKEVWSTMAPEPRKWKEAERISLIGDKISNLCSGDYECPSLVSLMLRRNKDLNSLPVNLFQYMPLLRVLDLSETTIDQLPADIDKLVALQYLNLSKTRITSLPREVGNLVKLRYLDLSETLDLEDIPEGVIQGLRAEMQVLKMLCSFRHWKVHPEDGSGIPFEELEALSQLKALYITVETTKAMSRLSGSPQLAPFTWRMHVRGLSGATTLDLWSALNRPMMRLEWLLISDSDNLKEVIIHDGGWCSSHYNLKHLCLLRLNRAQIIWNVKLCHGCPRNLVHLSIVACPRIEELIGAVFEEAEGDGLVAFPRLQSLNLSELPELKSICRSTLILPSLRILNVKGCPNLKRLPFGQHSGKKLGKISGDRDWWEGLEWDDDATKVSFDPRFTGPE